jgi:DNA-binding MarR family transcriptional regulator
MSVDAATSVLAALERIVVASVGVTARAVAAIAPDLTLLQWRVIVVLAGAPRGTSVSELATQLGSGLPAMSRLVGRLRSRGLVETLKDPADARVTVALLAPPGREIWERVSRHRREYLRDAVAQSALTAGEGNALQRLADRLLDVA